MKPGVEQLCFARVKRRMLNPCSHNERKSGKRDKLAISNAQWLLVLLLCLNVPSGAFAKTNSPWERVVMIGASVSAGFTASEPLGGPSTPQFRLSRYVDAALLVPHEPVQNLGNSFFFVQPELLGRQQIESALKAKPTLVLGVDFLFWFCYGAGDTHEQRLERFENALKMLEAIKCPLVLGDIPDASAAGDGMLRPEQIPGTNTMAAANQRLNKWAATRPNVVILRLSQFMRTVMANQALTIHDHKLPEGKTRVLLQNDKLHPSPHGCAVVALATLDALQSKQAFPSADIRWDPREIYYLVLKSFKASKDASAAKSVSPPAPGQK